VAVQRSPQGYSLDAVFRHSADADSDGSRCRDHVLIDRRALEANRNDVYFEGTPDQSPDNPRIAVE